MVGYVISALLASVVILLAILLCRQNRGLSKLGRIFKLPLCEMNARATDAAVDKKLSVSGRHPQAEDQKIALRLLDFVDPRTDDPL